MNNDTSENVFASAEGFEPSLKVPKTFVLASTLRTDKIPHSHEQGM